LASSSLSFHQCVVVGGEPVGLAAALTLLNPPYLYNVTVLNNNPLVVCTRTIQHECICININDLKDGSDGWRCSCSATPTHCFRVTL
jgi:hypothetical protein